MLTTMTDAAEQLGIPKQRLYSKVKEGLVTGRKVGRVVLIDPVKAKRELEQCGYFRRSAMYKRKKAAKGDGNSAADSTSL